MRWFIKYGSWWGIQFSTAYAVQLGFHLELRRRKSGATGYGPYLDIHIPCFIVSIGRHPMITGYLDSLMPSSRGGYVEER